MANPNHELFEGLIHNLDDPSYRAVPRISVSGLKKFQRSAAHGRAGLDGLVQIASPETLIFGQLCHTAVLEPDRLELDFVVAPKFDRRTKAGKAAAAEFEAGVGDRTVVTEGQYLLATRIRDSVLAHPVAAEILKEGSAEVSAFWRAPLDGQAVEVPVKGRLDWVTTYEGQDLIFDLKTCQDASAQDFPKSAGRFGYHLQAAFYSDGYHQLTGRRPRFVFGAVEKEPPFAVQLFEFDYASLARGRESYQRALRTYADAAKTGLYDGYPTDIHQMTLPPWVA